MKRFLAILLSALMVFSTMSVMATEVENETPEVPVETPEETGLTNVAFGRPVFASWTSGANEPDRMVDEDTTSGWVSNKFTASSATIIDGSYIWALVDLGSEYTIDEIKITVADNANYVSRDRQNYSVYVTNTRPETNIPINVPVDTMGMTEVYTAPSLANTTEGAPVENVIDVAAVEATQGNKYRYVFLQKSNIIDEAAKAAGGTGMGHWFWAINDLQVLTSDEVAEDAPRWIEVAKNRPAFAGKTYDGDTSAARNAIDGDVGTSYIAADWGAGIKSRFVVDLEAEYPIEGVVFTPRYTTNELHGFEIYATNDNTFEYMAQIHKQPLNAAVDYGHLYYEAPEALSGKKYRYIVVQADDANNNLGIADLKVYTSDITAERPFMINRSYITSINGAVTSDLGEDTAYPFKNLTDLESSTACRITSTNAQTGYLAVDLLVPQSVDYVTYAIEGFDLYHYGLEIVAANKADLSDGVVMFSAKDENGNYFCPVSETDTKGILLFPATEEMEGKKYRYVGLRFPYNETGVSGGANMFEVYTKGSNMSAAMSNAEITKAGYAFTLTIKDLLTINDKLSFIGAVYDTDGTLLEVKTADVKPAKKLNRSTTEVSATIDFDDSAHTDSNATVKLMLWDTISGTATPVLEEEFANLYEEKVIVYESVTQYATSHKATSNATAANYETDPSNRLVDGDLTTRYGAGPVGSAYYTFVDLGEGGRRVDKVVITVNDNISADRVKGQKYYLANTLPINGTDRSEWVYLGTRTENNTSMEFILTAEQAGTYRYVVADCTDAAVGDYVNEIEVYKDSDIVEPVVAQNVSRGKTVTASHAGYSTNNNTATITDGISYAANNGNQFIITTRPSAVCIDLDADYAIERVVVDAATKDFTKNVEVYISDFPTAGTVIPMGATKILEGTADGWDSSIKTIELNEAIDGRYVIVTMSAANSASFRLSEVSVYGIPTNSGSYETVASTAEVTSYYYQYGSANETNATGTMFTDCNSGTRGGRGQHWDIVWLDLGEAKAMDALRIQANDEYMAVPSTPMVFYVTNDEPGAGIAASIAENGKFVVPSAWLSVNGDGYSWTKTGISEVMCDLPVGEQYRYVVCTAPTRDFVNDSSNPGMPAYVSEITPFVLVKK